MSFDGDCKLFLLGAKMYIPGRGSWSSSIWHFEYLSLTLYGLSKPGVVGWLVFPCIALSFHFGPNIPNVSQTNTQKGFPFHFWGANLQFITLFCVFFRWGWESFGEYIQDPFPELCDRRFTISIHMLIYASILVRNTSTLCSDFGPDNSSTTFN